MRPPVPTRATAIVLAVACVVLHSGTTVAAPAGTALPPLLSPRQILVSAAASGHGESLFGPRDALLGLATLGAVAVSFPNDHQLSEESLEGTSRADRSLATAAQPLGNPLDLGPPMVLVWGLARVGGHPAVAAALARIGVSMVVAGACTQAVKLTAGRSRPDPALDDSRTFRPFSGAESFPSGHTTVAFSIAAAIDHETRSRWVPVIAYPLAGLVAWSRVHQRRHWTSDVLAGAALGGWAAWKTEDYLSSPGRRWLRGFGVAPAASPAGIALTRTF